MLKPTGEDPVAGRLYCYPGENRRRQFAPAGSQYAQLDLQIHSHILRQSHTGEILLSAQQGMSPRSSYAYALETSAPLVFNQLPRVPSASGETLSHFLTLDVRDLRITVIINWTS